MPKVKKTPEEIARLYFKMLVTEGIKYVHITKSNGTKEDREKTLQLLKDSLMILGYAIREVKSKYTVRLEKPL